MNDIAHEVSIIRGASHIIPQVIDDIRAIFLEEGFIEENAPEIDTEWNNFTVLNIPENHPCRDNHQSFFCDNGNLLRTHTSNMESRVLTKYNSLFKVFTIGRTYRKDDDATHTPMFHQLEVLVHSRNSSVKELMAMIQRFLCKFFQLPTVNIRIRPSYFPFTTPSYEIDMLLNDKWLEILGCGILHENIFKNLNQPMRYVMAFGCGIERLTMLKYGITDIREFYNHNPYNVHAHNYSYEVACI